jgi:hypothetical protein
MHTRTRLLMWQQEQAATDTMGLAVIGTMAHSALTVAVTHAIVLPPPPVSLRTRLPSCGSTAAGANRHGRRGPGRRRGPPPVSRPGWRRHDVATVLAAARATEAPLLHVIYGDKFRILL